MLLPLLLLLLPLLLLLSLPSFRIVLKAVPFIAVRPSSCLNDCAFLCCGLSALIILPSQRLCPVCPSSERLCLCVAALSTHHHKDCALLLHSVCPRHPIMCLCAFVLLPVLPIITKTVPFRCGLSTHHHKDCALRVAARLAPSSSHHVPLCHGPSCPFNSNGNQIILDGGQTYLLVREHPQQHGLPPTAMALITSKQRDGPNHLGLRCNALPGQQMALITSDCGLIQFLGSKWP